MDVKQMQKDFGEKYVEVPTDEALALASNRPEDTSLLNYNLRKLERIARRSEGRGEAWTVIQASLAKSVGL